MSTKLQGYIHINKRSLITSISECYIAASSAEKLAQLGINKSETFWSYFTSKTCISEMSKTKIMYMYSKRKRNSETKRVLVNWKVGNMKGGNRPWRKNGGETWRYHSQHLFWSRAKTWTCWIWSEIPRQQLRWEFDCVGSARCCVYAAIASSTHATYNKHSLRDHRLRGAFRLLMNEWNNNGIMGVLIYHHWLTTAINVCLIIIIMKKY